MHSARFFERNISGHNFHRQRRSLGSNKFKLWTSRDLLTDILTLAKVCVKTYGYRLLSLFVVEASLVPAFHVLFAEIYVHLPDDDEASCSSWPSLQYIHQPDFH